MGLILLDDLDCVGTELRLIDCPHPGIGMENCGHGEDAGVRCQPGTATTPVPMTTTPEPTTPPREQGIDI